MYVRKQTLALMLAVVLAAAHWARAGVTAVTSPNTMPTDDSVDWSTAGANGDYLASPLSVTSTNGLAVTVTQTNNNVFQRVDDATSWNGNFLPGDPLLWTDGSNGPITLTFAQAIHGVDLQIQDRSWGNFSATIQAYDASNQSLGLLTFNNGDSNGNADGSAMTIGAWSNSRDISKITIDDSSHDFAINNLSLAVVPEPSSLSLIAVGTCTMLLRRRRRAAVQP